MELFPREMLIDLLLALIPVLGGWLVYLIHQSANYLRYRRRVPWLETYLRAVETAVDGAVKSLMPLVEEAKALNRGGKLTPEQAGAFKREAVARVKMQLNREARKILGMVYNDLDRLLAQRVEAHVYDIKRGRK
ncbi:type II secretory pathway component PulJ [Desulfohalotomaculum tongense]|uniref:hypothetical protein n=1 Tax=Desulforadius tongensis TaxID=1216062 RepID=UPI0019587AEF|nr:hypothetical protein [Desulforadius tongensis]MBM7853676.1 type II secretory pathway component PulJ [Desulforadius tongensis]